jgi:uncharacterized protein YggE
MSSTLRPLAAAAFGALIVAVVALAMRPATVVGAPTTTSDEPAIHTITVSGTGTITLVPDTGHVGVGVTISKATVKGAREAAAKAMTDIIASIKALGVDEKDIKTVGLNLYPQYDRGTPAKVVGYQISEQVQVTVRDLDKVGDVADAAMTHGATEANGIWFDLADPAKAMDDARARAVEAARASADAMAKAAGVPLGTVVSISEPSQVVYPYPYAMGGAARESADALTPTPVNPGTQDLSATVTVVFEIG